MNRFILVNLLDNDINKAIKDFVNKNYTFVKNPFTGGDDDVILIDTLNKSYTYGEYGSTLLSSYFLSKFENVNKMSGGSNSSLNEIIKLSYENYFGQ
jgi:hypothetical protein